MVSAGQSVKDRILQAIDADEVVDHLVKLIRFNSVVGQPTKCWEYVAQSMRGLGLRVELYEIEDWKAAPMVVGFWEGQQQRPTLMFEGHFDTDPVDPAQWTRNPFGGEIDNDLIYGRGAVDSKGCLAGMLGAIAALKRSGVELSGSLILASPSDSESRFRGGDLLVDAGVIDRTDWILSGEATNCETVDVAHSGLTVFKLTVKGKAAHPGQMDKGVNAVYEMAKVVTAFHERGVKFRHEPYPYFPDFPRVFIQGIRNTPRAFEVPDECALVFVVLSVPGQTPDMIREDLETFLAELRSADPQLKTELKVVPRGWYYWRPPAEALVDDPLVVAIQNATEAVTGHRPRPAGFYGVYTTGAAINSRINRGKVGLPPSTVTFGPGEFRVAHTPDEHVSIEQLTNAARIYALTAAELLGAR